MSKRKCIDSSSEESENNSTLKRSGCSANSAITLVVIDSSDEMADNELSSTPSSRAFTSFVYFSHQAHQQQIYKEMSLPSHQLSLVKLNAGTGTFKKKRLWIWDHFKRVEDLANMARCKYCSATFVISGTGTMSKHVHTKHSEKIAGQTALNTKGEIVKQVRPFKFNMELAHQSFLAFIVTCNLPFSEGESPAFIELVNCLQPLYKPLSRTAVKDRVMVTYVRTRNQIIESLRASKVALTKNSWTSPNKKEFMGITVTPLNEKFQPMEPIVISFKQVQAGHSGKIIAQQFYDSLTVYEIHERILSVTTSNVANSDETFIEHLTLLTMDSSRPFDRSYWICCFANILNLCVKKIMECISDLLLKLRNLVTSLRSSPQWIKQFNGMLKDFKLNDLNYEEVELLSFDEGEIIEVYESDGFLPILDCPERWSSSFFFVRRGLQLKEPLNEIAKGKDLLNGLSDADWNTLEQVFALLEEFASVTTGIEGNQYPTLSMVIPLFNGLLTMLEDVSLGKNDKITHPLIISGAEAGLLILSSYYEKTSPVAMAATYMDPRWKMQYFVENGWESGGETRNSFRGIDENLIVTRVRPAIKDVWRNYKKETPIPYNTSVNSNKVTEPNGKAKKSTSVYQRPDIMAFVANAISKRRRAERDEMKEYEAEDTEPPNCKPDDVFCYWANQNQLLRWPRLAAMAKDLLSIPAMSAGCVRGFSISKDLFGLPFMNLNPETIEALVCLRSWYNAGLVKENVQGFLEGNFGIESMLE